MEAVASNITRITTGDDPANVEGDAAWVLASSALVLLMTPGLAFFYGGLVSENSILNTMMMSFIAMGIISVIWCVVGFSLAFSEGCFFVGGFKYFMLYGLDGQHWADTTIWSLVFAIFQMTFAIITAAIISGSLVERMYFPTYTVFIALWSLLVYVPICHWVWGSGGWILELGALDFAGGTVVHVSSGTSGLVAAWLLGPRTNRKGEKPNNVPFVLLGAGLLWFGWTGFNAGSALAADGVAARAIATTYLAASASMLTWAGTDAAYKKHCSAVSSCSGALAGLVVITPAAGYVSPFGALAMGILGAPVCYFAVARLNRFEKLDDTLDAFGLHGVGGITGALLTGVFALDGGLFYGSGFKLLGKQALGVTASFGYSALATTLIFKLLKLCVRMRVEEHLEDAGLDEHLHGELAYFSPKNLRDDSSNGGDSSESSTEAETTSRK